ncbi:hypothetical protein BGZ93_004410 [Podila epicladia]|nr:hypothetical protein BGZ92_004031 [Podila epicladia]KAG0096512.1 hypothetical protein BGZ93_004410 [Podila epicladia]
MSTSDHGANPVSAIIPGSIFQDDIPPPSSTNTDMGEPQEQAPPPYYNPNGGRTQIEITSTIQIVLISLGVVVGALFLLGVIAAYYISHKNKRAREESKNQLNTLEQGNKKSILPRKPSWIMRYLGGGKRNKAESEAHTTMIGGKAEKGSTCVAALNEKQEVTDDYEGRDDRDAGVGSGFGGREAYSGGDDDVTNLKVMASSQAAPSSAGSTHGLLDSVHRSGYNSTSEYESLAGYEISRSGTQGLEPAFHASSNNSSQYTSLGRGRNTRNTFIDVAQVYARRQSMIDPVVLGPATLSKKLPANVRMSMFLDPSRMPVIHHQQQQHIHSVPVTMDYATDFHIISTNWAPSSQPPTPGVGNNASLNNLLQDPFKTNNNSDTSLNLLARDFGSEEEESNDKGKKGLLGDNSLKQRESSSSPRPPTQKDIKDSPHTTQLIPRQRTASPTLVTYHHTMHTPLSAPLPSISPQEKRISYQPPSRPTSPPTGTERPSRRNSAILLGARRKSIGGIPPTNDPSGAGNCTWHRKRASVVIPEGMAPVRLWKEDAAVRADVTPTTTPLMSVTIPASGMLGSEENQDASKEEAARDGAAVFEGRSTSRRPSRDKELTLKSGELTLTEEGTSSSQPPQRQIFARKWAEGQIAVDISSEQDEYLSKPEGNAVVRLSSPTGCLLEDDDELSSFLYASYAQEQHLGMTSGVESNMSMFSQHDYALHLQQQQQQKQQQEILEQYQFPKAVRRAKNPGRSYLDDFRDQQQPQTHKHKHRHSVMGLGGLGEDARELSKKLTGKIRSSMFLTSTSSTAASATTTAVSAANTNTSASNARGAAESSTQNS